MPKKKEGRPAKAAPELHNERIIAMPSIDPPKAKVKTANYQDTDVIRAFLDIASHAQCFTAALAEAERQLASLPADDFFKRQTAGLREPITAYLEHYEDKNECANRAIPISLPATRNALLPGLMVMSSLLFQWGHESVGIGLVGSDGLGIAFKRTSPEDVVYRQLIQIQGPVQ